MMDLLNLYHHEVCLDARGNCFKTIAGRVFLLPNYCLIHTEIPTQYYIRLNITPSSPSPQITS